MIQAADVGIGIVGKVSVFHVSLVWGGESSFGECEWKKADVTKSL